MQPTHCWKRFARGKLSCIMLTSSRRLPPIGHSYQLEIINKEKLEAGNVIESRVIPDEFADNSSDWNRD